MDDPSRTWTVLLLGGASGVGKTSLAYRLAAHYGFGVIELDDIQTALEVLITPEQQPLLHLWRTHWNEFSAFTDDQHVEHFLDVSRGIFQPALEAVIGDRLERGIPSLIEGDFILPELAVREEFNGQANDGRVRALFVHEEDEARIADNFAMREGGNQSFVAHTSWLKVTWLRKECARLGVPDVAVRPWDTLAERAVGAVSEAD
jgi:2-phosphoglycerate kinase